MISMGIYGPSVRYYEALGASTTVAAVRRLSFVGKLSPHLLRTAFSVIQSLVVAECIAKARLKPSRRVALTSLKTNFSLSVGLAYISFFAVLVRYWMAFAIKAFFSSFIFSHSSSNPVYPMVFVATLRTPFSIRFYLSSKFSGSGYDTSD
jgi:hypothetical protein